MNQPESVELRWQSWVAVGAGVAAVLGAFMPWAKVSAPLLGSLSKSGIDGGDGWFAVLGGGVLAIVAAIALGQRQIGWAHIITWAIAGVGLTFLGAWEWLDARRVLGDVDNDMVLTSIGYGIYLVGAAGMAGVTAALFAVEEFQRR